MWVAMFDSADEAIAAALVAGHAHGQGAGGAEVPWLIADGNGGEIVPRVFRLRRDDGVVAADLNRSSAAAHVGAKRHGGVAALRGIAEVDGPEMQTRIGPFHAQDVGD